MQDTNGSKIMRCTSATRKKEEEGGSDIEEDEVRALRLTKCRCEKGKLAFGASGEVRTVGSARLDSSKVKQETQVQCSSSSDDAQKKKEAGKRLWRKRCCLDLVKVMEKAEVNQESQ